MNEEVVVHRQQITPWEQMKEEARAIGASGLFPHIDTMEKAVAICLLGRDLGLTVSQSIYGINVIKGRPSLSANLMQQLIIKHHGGNALYYRESTTTSCILEYKRKDADKGGEYPYTIEDAKRAGLTSKDVWQKDPAAMLRARALSNVARMVFADAIGGSYLSDEVEEVPATARTTVAPTPPPLAPPRSPTPAPSPQRQSEPEEASFTVVNEHNQQVDPTTGEVMPVPGPLDPPVEVVRGTMSDDQRKMIRTMQAELGYSLEVQERSYEEAADYIRQLGAERDRREEAAKKAPKKRRTAAEVAADKATVAEADARKQVEAAKVAPPTPPTPAVSPTGELLLKARRLIADISDGFQVYLSDTHLRDEIEGQARRQQLLHLYHALVAGRGEGSLEPHETEGVSRLFLQLRGHQNIPAIVSHQNVKAFVTELLEEAKDLRHRAELAELEAMPLATEGDKAKEKEFLDKAKAEQTAVEAQEKSAEPDPLWDVGE